jgi:GTP-binding protein
MCQKLPLWAGPMPANRPASTPSPSKNNWLLLPRSRVEPSISTCLRLGKQGITDAVLADLPGYGYAAVPKQDKLRWQKVMANYLVTRENLKGIVLLCDPRLGMTELDEVLLEVIRPRVEEGLNFLVLLTKSDKLTRAEATKALSIAKLQAGGGQAKLFSALKKQGVEELAQLMWDWTHQDKPMQHAEAEPPEEDLEDDSHD